MFFVLDNNEIVVVIFTLKNQEITVRQWTGINILVKSQALCLLSERIKIL